jgi:hypothetical protein
MLLPGLTAEESKRLILSVGTHHGKRPLSPTEVAILFRKALFRGASREECASFVRLKGPDMVSRFLRLLDLNPFVQHSTDWRQTGPTVSFTSAWKLSTLPTKAQEEACIEIMANQLTTKEVEQVVQLQQRSGRRFAECLSEVVGMRPSITKVYVILGAITDAKVKEWLGKITQLQRDNVFTQVLAEAYPAITSCSGRLGTEKFSIVTNEQGYTLINRDASFETSITKTLAGKMVLNHV